MVNRSYCEMCPDFALENTEHLLIHCPYLEEQRDTMFKQINNLEEYYDVEILSPLENNLHTLLGRVPAEAIPKMMFYFYKIVATNVHQMYTTLLKSREGIG